MPTLTGGNSSEFCVKQVPKVISCAAAWKSFLVASSVCFGQGKVYRLKIAFPLCLEGCGGFECEKSIYV
jgi:hypothetical protein